MIRKFVITVLSLCLFGCSCELQNLTFEAVRVDTMKGDIILPPGAEVNINDTFCVLSLDGDVLGFGHNGIQASYVLTLINGDVALELSE